MPNIPSIRIGNTTYSVKDTVAREHLIEVSDTQPSSSDNRLWIKNAENEFQIPTYREFSNLVSEVDNKIDNPSNVPAGRFMQTNYDGTAIWGDPVSKTEIVTAVENWLDENIPAEHTLTIDRTLTVSGSAADAKVVGDMLALKVDKVDGKGLSENDFTSALKNKLDGISQGANKTIVDSSFSALSTNPVQNAVIKSALDSKVEYDMTVAELMQLGGA